MLWIGVELSCVSASRRRGAQVFRRCPKPLRFESKPYALPGARCTLKNGRLMYQIGLQPSRYGRKKLLNTERFGGIHCNARDLTTNPREDSVKNFQQVSFFIR